MALESTVAAGQGFPSPDHDAAAAPAGRRGHGGGGGRRTALSGGPTADSDPGRAAPESRPGHGPVSTPLSTEYCLPRTRRQ